MSSKIKVDTIENVAGSGNVSLGSGHNLVVPGTVSITGDLTVDTTTLKVDSSNNRVGIGTTSPSARLDVTSTDSDAVFLRSSQSTTTNVYITNTNATANNTANLYFAPANNVAGSQISSIAIEDFSTSANRTAELAFFTRKDGTMSESMRLDSDRRLLVGTTSSSYSDTGCRISAGGSIQNTVSGGQLLRLNRTTSTGDMVQFWYNGGEKGTISTNGSNVAYNTSSDYRLKENVVTDWDATTRLKTLKPSRFNWKADADTTVDGFLAHEVSSIVPEAVTGEKDAVDADGNPNYQGIDQSKLVPLLTKALQEAISEIDLLKEKVKALESK